MHVMHLEYYEFDHIRIFLSLILRVSLDLQGFSILLTYLFYSLAGFGEAFKQPERIGSVLELCQQCVHIILRLGLWPNLDYELSLGLFLGGINLSGDFFLVIVQGLNLLRKKVEFRLELLLLGPLVLYLVKAIEAPHAVVVNHFLHFLHPLTHLSQLGLLRVIIRRDSRQILRKLLCIGLLLLHVQIFHFL